MATRKTKKWDAWAILNRHGEFVAAMPTRVFLADRFATVIDRVIPVTIEEKKCISKK